jgi:hypothetical protein
VSLSAAGDNVTARSDHGVASDAGFPDQQKISGSSRLKSWGRLFPEVRTDRDHAAQSEE